MNNTLQTASVVATFTALILATNYALIGIPNVKLMDLLVFIAGFRFGCLVGASVGALSWCIYGTLNPYGFSLPILISTSLGETIYGLVGGLLRMPVHNPINKAEWLTFSIKFGVFGFLLTFLYDLETNLVFAYTFGVPVPVALAMGVPFAVTHEVSNALLFALAGPPIVFALKKLKGGDKNA